MLFNVSSFYSHYIFSRYIFPIFQGTLDFVAFCRSYEKSIHFNYDFNPEMPVQYYKYECIILWKLRMKYIADAHNIWQKMDVYLVNISHYDRQTVTLISGLLKITWFGTAHSVHEYDWTSLKKRVKKIVESSKADVLFFLQHFFRTKRDL